MLARESGRPVGGFDLAHQMGRTVEELRTCRYLLKEGQAMEG